MLEDLYGIMVSGLLLLKVNSERGDYERRWRRRLRLLRNPGKCKRPNQSISLISTAECSLIPSCLQRVAISVDKTLDKLPKVAISFLARGCTSFCGIAYVNRSSRSSSSVCASSSPA